MIEDRWEQLMRGTRRIGHEPGLSPVNSKRWRLIDDTLEELAAMLAGGEVADDQMDSLWAARDGIWDEIRARIIAWVEANSRETAGAAR